MPKGSGANSKNGYLNSLKQTAKTKTADLILNVFDEEHKKNNPRQAKIKKVRYRTGSTQDDIPLKNMKDGIYVTSDGRYVSFIEVLPINYDRKSDIVKQRVSLSFKRLFANGPKKFALKIMNDVSNPSLLIESIKKNCKNKSYPGVKEALEAYIAYLRDLSQTGTTFSRYFLIFEYEGDKSDWADIRQDMAEQRAYYHSQLIAAKNIPVDTNSPDDQALEFLYYFFNRNSSKKYSVRDRATRMQKDFNAFNKQTGKEKRITASDLVAPKGFDTRNRNYIKMDGTYYGFLGITSESFPNNVDDAWLRHFNYGSMVDIDVIFRKLPKQSTQTALRQYNKLTRKTARSKAYNNDQEKAEKYIEKFQNNQLVYNNMAQGDDLYNVAVILTVRAVSPRQLGEFMRAIKKDMVGNQIEFDDSFCCCEQYLYMTMPFLYTTKPYHRLKHNMTTSMIKSMYPFTSYQVWDPTGFLLGQMNDSANQSAVAVNNFNSLMYSNANMVLLGASGKGKTFTEQLISSRLFFNGVTCFFIIPKKGYEYKRGCDQFNGTYISMVPGAKQCINILEIRPEAQLDMSLINTDDVIISNASLLTKKIASFTSWIRILLRNQSLTNRQVNIISQEMTAMYLDYEITEDNDSIYKDHAHTKLKKMPILEEIQERLKRHQEMQEVCDALEIFVTGNFKNFNGQTNVDLSTSYIVFDVDEDQIGEELHPAILYIGYDFTYDRIKSGYSGKSAIFMDEVWKMLATKESASQVRNMVKLVRGYGACTIMATQEIEDFMNSSDGFGRSVINNSNLKLVLGMNEDDLKLLRNSVNLSREEYEKILEFPRGEGMLITNGDKIDVVICASPFEINLFSDKTAKNMKKQQ